MMTLLGNLREDLHSQVGDTDTKISEERFLDIRTSFLQSSYFIELCLFRSRFGNPISPNEVKTQVCEDVLKILSKLANRQEIFTLIGLHSSI